MKPQYILTALAGSALALGACQAQMAGVPAMTQTHEAALAAEAAPPTRTPTNPARDRYRNPVETLSFFGVQPSDTVVEIWPGGGWYTQILAPYLGAGGGRLILATPDGQLGGVARHRDAHPDLYGNLTTVTFPAFDVAAQRLPDGTADVVLTFRNVHNWRMGYLRDDKADYSARAFGQIYAMLRPGGTLGIVDHRLPEDASDERERNSGYIKESTVKRLAQQAGFQLVAESQVNANPRDTANWPNGVWTLPPTLGLKDQDRDKYLAIGESDRMTLRFVKPER
jgi:predicted methyltransferase